MTTQETMKTAQALIDNNALIFISHSGGKDSQAMYLTLTQDYNIPDENIIIIHADLHEMDWEGSQDHIENTTHHPLVVCSANKTFFEMVRRRNENRPNDPSFPSSKYRQCTSDLKRDPINKEIRRIMTERGATQAINCIGIRAQESAARAKKNPWTENKRLSTAGRQVWDWLPILEMTEIEVFTKIAQAGQEPFWTYAQGMTRKSCKVCIMASEKDLCTSAQIDPEFFQTMVALEEETNSTVFSGKSLLDILEKNLKKSA